MASKTKLNSAQQVRIRTPNFIEECSNDMRTGRLHREPDNRCDTSRQRFSFETGNCSTYPGRQTSSGLLTSSERKSWRWSGLIPMFRNARLRLALAWVDEMPLYRSFPAAAITYKERILIASTPGRVGSLPITMQSVYRTGNKTSSAHRMR